MEEKKEKKTVTKPRRAQKIWDYDEIARSPHKALIDEVFAENTTKWIKILRTKFYIAYRFYPEKVNLDMAEVVISCYQELQRIFAYKHDESDKDKGDIKFYYYTTSETYVINYMIKRTKSTNIQYGGEFNDFPWYLEEEYPEEDSDFTEREDWP